MSDICNCTSIGELLTNYDDTQVRSDIQQLNTDINTQTGRINTALSDLETAKTTKIAEMDAAKVAAETATAAAIVATQNADAATQATQTAIAQAERLNVELEGSVITVTNKTGTPKSIDLLDATNERVYIEISSDDPDFDPEGIGVNVFYEQKTIPEYTLTTDSNGHCQVDIPNGTKYRLVFPTIAGYETVGDINRQAHISTRTIGVEYKVTVPQPEVGEQLMLVVQKSVKRVHSKLEGVHVVITYDGALQTDYYTNENGEIGVVIPFGKEYTIEMPKLAGLHLASGRFHRHLVAEQSRRTYVITYDDYESGAFIITNASKKYSLEDFEAARQLPVTDPDYVQNSDAKAIIVETDELENVEGRFGFTGVFGLDIDLVRTTNFNSTNWKKSWATDYVEFTSISPDGKSITDSFYFDGLTASELIYDEQVELSVTTGAVNLCRSQSITIGSTVHPGFLGSIGQWQALYLLISDVDEILRSVRPEGYYPTGTQLFEMSSFDNVVKWTSAQYYRSNSYYWTNRLGSDFYKTSPAVVVPFFAF